LLAGLSGAAHWLVGERVFLMLLGARIELTDQTAVGTQHVMLPRARSLAVRFDGTRTLLSTVSTACVPNDMESIEISVSNNAFGSGVVVSGLGHGTAAEAGLVVGDVITHVNGRVVRSHVEAIDIMRSASEEELIFALAGKACQLVIDRSRAGKVEITVTNLRKGPGVLVERVGAHGLAEAAGVRTGDHILAVNGVLVHDHAQAIAMIDSCKGNVALSVAESDYEFEFELGSKLGTCGVASVSKV